MSKLGIITVVTNEKHNLKDFYFSLSQQSFKDFSIYFVDNNSGDRSQEYFKEMNSSGALKVNYITLSYNSGFSGGCNIGAGAAIKDGCKYLFLSNNDLVFDKFAIEELYKLAEADRNLACIGPLLMMHSEKNPDVIQEFGGKINFKKGTLEKYYTVKNIHDVILPETLDTDFVGGGVCFIDAEVFNNSGMYETSYFGYFDEIDLSYRLKVQNKYKMMVTSKAKIWHNHSSAGKNKRSYYLEYYLSERNKFLYYRKYGFYKSMVLTVLSDIVKFPVRLVWFMKVCDFKLGMYYLRGMLDGLLNKQGKPKLSIIK